VKEKTITVTTLSSDNTTGTKHALLENRRATLFLEQWFSTWGSREDFQGYLDGT